MLLVILFVRNNFATRELIVVEIDKKDAKE